MLESEGIAVSLQNLHPEHPVVASGLRVRINEDDLPLALRIIENSEIFINQSTPEKSHTGNLCYLVPVDFTPHSLKACDLAFALAQRHGATLNLLNAIIDPSVADSSPLSDTLDYAVADTELRKTLFNEAYSRLKKLSAQLRSRIKSGELPPVKYSAQVIEGIPEEVIIQYARENRPDMIIMGTRGKATRERESIGSVTAEVLDSCRIPVITLPEDTPTEHITNLSHAVMFCDMNQSDLLAIDVLYRTFDNQPLTVEMISVPDSRRPWRRTKKDPAEMLLAYCREHYPRFTFKFRSSDQSTIDEDIASLMSEIPIGLIVAPNHRRSPLTRLFNPSIAHRLLFHTDIPMLVIPV